eukprot:TRINITY_DN8451_c0_g1_i1.p1 TRINITY_DN8451_c0_g1~~TRINITY_DN8451_c0_g1_i1.p1  ORF type:complete len:1129 (+),score=408.74 TRINITY_DN8451_c0_g1_i1:48-3389(+)
MAEPDPEAGVADADVEIPTPAPREPAKSGWGTWFSRSRTKPDETPRSAAAASESAGRPSPASGPGWFSRASSPKPSGTSPKDGRNPRRWFFGGAGRDVTVTLEREESEQPPPEEPSVMDEALAKVDPLSFFSTEELEGMAKDYFQEQYAEYETPTTMPGRRDVRIGWNAIDVTQQHRYPRFPPKAEWSQPWVDDRPAFCTGKGVTRGSVHAPIRLTSDDAQQRFEFICKQLQFSNPAGERRPPQHRGDTDREKAEFDYRRKFIPSDDPILVANFRNIGLSTGSRVVRLCGSVSQCKTVVCLSLNGAHLRKEGIEQLSRALTEHPSLTRLELSGNRIGAAGAVHLGKLLRLNTKLVHLDASMNDIGDAGCEQICRGIMENRDAQLRWTSSIRFLNLSTNKLGAYGGYFLSRLVRDYDKLNVLQLWRNNLGASPRLHTKDGWSCIAEVLWRSVHLRHLDVSYNGIKDKVLNEFCDTLDSARVRRNKRKQAGSQRAQDWFRHASGSGGGGFGSTVRSAVGAGASMLQSEFGQREETSATAHSAQSLLDSRRHREETSGSALSGGGADGGGIRSLPGITGAVSVTLPKREGGEAQAVSSELGSEAESEDDVGSRLQITVGLGRTVGDFSQLGVTTAMPRAQGGPDAGVWKEWTAKEIKERMESETGQKLVPARVRKRQLVLKGNLQAKEVEERLALYFHLDPLSWKERRSARSRFARIVRDVTKPRPVVPEEHASKLDFHGVGDNNVWTFQVELSKKAQAKREQEREVERERVAREVEREKREAAERELQAESEDVTGAFNALITQMHITRARVKELAEMGSPSDDDLRMLEEAWVEYRQQKEETTELLRGPGRVSPDADACEDAVNLFVGVLSEGDQRAGSVELVKALLDRVGGADFAAAVEDGGLVPQQCADGNMQFLTVLLDHPTLLGRHDMVDTVSAACFSQTARIPLALAVLPRVHIAGDALEELKDVLREFLFDICYSRRVIPKENRQGREALVRLLLAHDALAGVDFSLPDEPGGTLWSRACFDGDVGLMHLFMETLPAGATDSAARLEDGGTPLLQAVLSKNIYALRLALSRPGAGAAVTLADQEGNTPISVAELMQREDMLDMLRAEL